MNSNQTITLTSIGRSEVEFGEQNRIFQIAHKNLLDYFYQEAEVIIEITMGLTIVWCRSEQVGFQYAEDSSRELVERIGEFVRCVIDKLKSQG